jgi:glucuronate isomerase
MEIRKATSNDIKELASLMEQLGYQTSIEQMSVRYKNTEDTPNHYTLVASYEGKVVGMVGFHTGVLYNTDGIGLNSGNRTERNNAYQFYENMGYVAKSTEFAKSLI